MPEAGPAFVDHAYFAKAALAASAESLLRQAEACRDILGTVGAKLAA